jgi:hypothetical protein
MPGTIAPGRTLIGLPAGRTGSARAFLDIAKAGFAGRQIYAN